MIKCSVNDMQTIPAKEKSHINSKHPGEYDDSHDPTLFSFDLEMSSCRNNIFCVYQFVNIKVYISCKNFFSVCL